MRLNRIFKGFFILGLILLLGISFSTVGTTVAHAEETQAIKLNVNSQTIVKGRNFSIHVYNLTEGQTVAFHSSSPAIASVNSNGIVSANEVGDATILVTVYEGTDVIETLSCKITVGTPAMSIQFSTHVIRMEIGSKKTLTRNLQPLNSVEAPRFSSYNKKIASVSAGGRITARAEGMTYIFAQIDNGRFAVCKVYVYAKPEDAANTEGATTPAATAYSAPDSQAGTVEDLSVSEMRNTTDIDFATFIKNLNASGKTAAGAESTSDNAN